MAVIAMVVFGVVALVAALVAIGSVKPFLEVRRFHAATITPVASVVKGMQATVRGTVTEARRPPQYPRLTPGDVVHSRLQVTEQVGKQQHVALRAKNPQLFGLKDEFGNSIDVDPEMAELADAHEAAQKSSACPPELQGYINQAGSYRWPNTPAQCHEEAIRVGDVVTLRGNVFLPLPAQIKEGDSELRINATKLSLYVDNPWKGENGRRLLISIAVTVVTLAATLGSAAGAGLL